jgi:hypothetical protein
VIDAITLHVLSTHDYVTLQLDLPGRPNPPPANISSRLWRSHAEALRRVFESCLLSVPASAENARAVLLQQAHSAFRGLFDSTGPFGSALRGALLANPRFLRVNNGNQAPLPWELLAPEPIDASAPSLSVLVGARTTILRQVPPTDRLDRIWPRGDVTFDRKPRIGIAFQAWAGTAPDALFSDGFDRADILDRADLDYLQPLPARGPIHRNHRRFAAFMAKKHHVKHFACHAVADPNPRFSVMVVAEGYEIHEASLHAVKGPRLGGSPIAFLNACQSGCLAEGGDFSFAGFFLNSGARAAIATECTIPPHVARRFAEGFYDHLLKGLPLAEALLLTKEGFLGAGDPAGLAYALYALADNAPSLRLRSVARVAKPRQRRHSVGHSR